MLAKAGATLPAVPDPDWEALAQKVRDRIDAAPPSQASTAGRAGSVPRTVPSPQKTKAPSVPKQLVATPPRALAAKPTLPPAPVRNRPSPASTVASVSTTPSTISRQSSVWSQTTSTSNSTSASGRIPRAPLSLNDVTVHGNLEAKISQKELEVRHSLPTASANIDYTLVWAGVCGLRARRRRFLARSRRSGSVIGINLDSG